MVGTMRCQSRSCDTRQEGRGEGRGNILLPYSLLCLLVVPCTPSRLCRLFVFCMLHPLIRASAPLGQPLLPLSIFSINIVLSPSALQKQDYLSNREQPPGEEALPGYVVGFLCRRPSFICGFSHQGEVWNTNI